jgi:hypothetical protein
MRTEVIIYFPGAKIPKALKPISYSLAAARLKAAPFQSYS